MAAGQGGGGGNNGTGSGTAPGSGAAGLGIPAHLTLSFSSGPHWGAAALPQSHTVRSLERALEEAGSSGILCLSGRKLRDFPGSGCDLSDTTQAGHLMHGYRESPPLGALSAWGSLPRNTLKLSQLAKGPELLPACKMCVNINNSGDKLRPFENVGAENVIRALWIMDKRSLLQSFQGQMSLDMCPPWISFI
ncbi:leucine-rich repeat and calponin homology domain-containing protein 2 isoform X2 [Parus major]|uniref:leucine-rich repeat and calponin homology domain-containing protein 2 isoform X2 n=1 Tax=Parus major TaxID=9157 RepID=UPI00077117AD|nr:leucine-rich repeat and calponin homology domain-containing protein 2 isoform X2 [Parus major]